MNVCKWKETDDVCSKYEEGVINLKDYLTNYNVEETVHINEDRFRADLYWYNPMKPQNNIMIEIKVTHECTYKKKESKNRIIEFEVHSEEDVERIVHNDIREGESVRFYGFTPNEIIDEDIPARHILNKFVYYRSGKAYPRLECDCKTYMNRRKSALLEITVKVHENYDIIPPSATTYDSGNLLAFGRLYNWGLSLAKSEGFDVRNCYYCKHHKFDFETDELSCELTEKEVSESTKALTCVNFVFDDASCNKNLAEFQQYSQYHVVDVWKK